jgi:phage gpG-like protein
MDLLEVTIVGAARLGDAMKKIKDTTEKELLKALNKTAIQTERLARGKAPHDKGGLWNSIHAEPARVTANNVEARVGTNLEYARAQEYGTVGMIINVPNGRRTSTGGRTRPYTFKGNIKPHNFFKDAKQEIRPVLTENLQQASKNIISAIAGV